MSKYALPAAALLSLIAFPAKADHPSGAGNSLNAGPIRTITADTLKAGDVVTSFTTEFVKLDEFSDAELADFAAQHIHAHSVDYMLTSALGLSYGLADDLTLSVRLPYVYRDNIRAGHHSHGPAGNTAEDHGDAGGISDISAMAQWRFFTQYDFKSALLFGIKAPTGETGKKHDGEKQAAEHQPGSGSWDPMAGAAVTKKVGPVAVDANILATFVGEGSQETDLGNRFNYNVAVSYRFGEEHFHKKEQEVHLHNAWDLTLELNGEWVADKQEEGEAERNSGGNQIFLSPGVRYTHASNWSGFLSVGLPIVNDVGDGHTETDYKVTGGISKGF